MLNIESISKYLADEAIKKAIKENRPELIKQIKEQIKLVYPIKDKCPHCKKEISIY